MCDRCLKECLSHQVQTDSVIGQDALQLLVDDVYSLVCWAASKGSKLVGKATRLASCDKESHYHEHETEHDTVAADDLHDDTNPMASLF